MSRGGLANNFNWVESCNSEAAAVRVFTPDTSGGVRGGTDYSRMRGIYLLGVSGLGRSSHGYNRMNFPTVTLRRRKTG
jgi:hypothetical protein